MDLKHAFELESKGEAFITLDSLTAIFAGMSIFPTQEQLVAILETFGQREEDDYVSFELFARSVALMLEEYQDKVSTSSQQEQHENQYTDEQGDPEYQHDMYGQEEDEDGEKVMDDPYYNEYEVDYAG